MSYHYTLLAPHDYAAQVIAEINDAKARVYLATTTLIDDDTFSRGIIDALKYAAARGLDVRVAADAFTYTELRNFNLGSHFQTKRAKQARVLSDSMRAAGVKVRWMGQYAPLAILGRTHSKWCVIDNEVYSFGGVNLDKRSFSNIDYMLHTSSKELSDIIASLHKKMVSADKAHRTYKSYSVAHGDDTVLVDGGFVGNSIIYKRACELTAQAKSVVLVSQYCPTGKLSQLLNQKQATLYFNHWSRADNLNRALIRFGMKMSKLNTQYKKVPYLHAKCILFTMADDQKIALTGSHNFVYGGVLAGTREIALETSNEKLINQLEQFIQREVA